ncbi:hypothetical protein HYFRA_00002374 [Hymenoscyphus fraxineus]|uniref:Uncharacterized protein n=1 Tax=Hymenoscyphus fraxineus TaxID=746836 RepID=A0A9N9LCA6_9HELO|nr:hypothetical protein HYFRA_00002374 [Hymenoscyphus fraxineus]
MNIKLTIAVVLTALNMAFAAPLPNRGPPNWQEIYDPDPFLLDCQVTILGCLDGDACVGVKKCIVAGQHLLIDGAVPVDQVRNGETPDSELLFFIWLNWN